MRGDYHKSFASSALRHKRTAGFTLIELLVVIAIIALLVSILLPSLKTAKELAKSAVCMSNTKSIGTALFLYANDSNGYIPSGYASNAYLNYFDNFWHTRLTGCEYFPGTLRPDGYYQLSDVLHCPGTDQKTESQLVAEFGATGKWIWEMAVYGMREYSITNTDPGRYLDKPLAEIPQTAEFFLVADSWMTTYATQGYNICYIPGSGVAWKGNLVHNDRANTLMADGHVAAEDFDYFYDQKIGAPSYASAHYGMWPE